MWRKLTRWFASYLIFTSFHFLSVSIPLKYLLVNECILTYSKYTSLWRTSLLNNFHCFISVPIHSSSLIFVFLLSSFHRHLHLPVLLCFKSKYGELTSKGLNDVEIYNEMMRWSILCTKHIPKLLCTTTSVEDSCSVTFIVAHISCYSGRLARRSLQRRAAQLHPKLNPLWSRIV